MIIPLKFHYFYTTFPYFRFGHFSDRTFFVTPAVTQLSSLLSVINIDSLIVCLQIALLSFILLLCSGKLPLRRGAKLAFHNEKLQPAISGQTGGETQSLHTLAV